jgi:hypothetical protein
LTFFDDFAGAEVFKADLPFNLSGSDGDVGNGRLELELVVAQRLLDCSDLEGTAVILQVDDEALVSF